MTALREHSFSSAKTGLSNVMDDVVHGHRPQVVQRHGGKESMLLVRPDDVRRWLDTFKFELMVTLDPGEVAISADPVGVIGVGDSLDSALDDLVDVLRLTATRFFEQPELFRHTSDAPHEPWLLRFALTHPDAQRELLEADIEASVPKGGSAGVSAV